MSLISPEVLWTIRESEAYDIEVIDNKLFLFGPMLDNADQALKNMMSDLEKIAHALEDNIDTYRDARLPYQEGRIDVGADGKRLNEDLAQKIALVVIIIFSVPLLVFGILLEAPSFALQGGTLIVVCVAVFVQDMIQKKKQDKTKDTKEAEEE